MKKMSLLALVLTGLLGIGSTFLEAAEPLMVQDMENMEIITPSAPEGGCWAVAAWGIGVPEEYDPWLGMVFDDPEDPNGYDDITTFDRPYPLIIYPHVDPDYDPPELVNIPAGYRVKLIFDGGKEKTVYLPHIIGADLVDIEMLGFLLYVADDGSTYYDEALTQLAQAAGEVTPFSIKESAITKLEGAKTGDREIDREINRVIHHIQGSLQKSLWLDPWHLTTFTTGKKDRHGKGGGLRVFHEEKKAVMRMLIKAKIRYGGRGRRGREIAIPSQVRAIFEEVTEDLVQADKLIAEKAVEEVKVFSGIDKRVDIQIKIAERELSWALREVKPSKAITRFGLAWKHAQLAKKLALSPPLVGKTVAKFTNLLEDAFAAGSWEDLTQAAATLMEMGKPAVPYLLTAFKDSSKNEMIRKMYAEILGEIKDSSAVGPLVEVLNNLGETEFIRAEAASTLGKIGDETALNPLLNTLDDESEQVRSMAAYGLGYLGNSNAVVPLIGKLTDPSELMRNRVIRVLGALQDSRAVEPLINCLEDPSESVATQAILSLGALKDSRAIVPLIDILETKTGIRQVSAMRALGQLGDTRAVEPLINILQGQNEYLMIYAGLALAKIGDQRAVEPLRAAIERVKDEFVKKKLKEAYKILTGEEYQ